MSGTLYIISAPSGAGKTSLVAALLKTDPDVRLSVSYTTRAPRPGEVNGREYNFVTVAQFERMEQAGEFLESAHVFGNRYGTSTQWISARIAEGHEILLEIDWQGAAQVRRLRPDAVTIFILPPSFEVLQKRLSGRESDAPDVIAHRITAAREEITHVIDFNYVIINDEFERAARDLSSIVRAERLKRARQFERHSKLINRLLKPE
jgi:guanylate kinase